MRRAAETGESVYIAAKDPDGDGTFIDVSKRVDTAALPAEGAIEVYLEDPRKGLLGGGLPLLASGVVMIVLGAHWYQSSAAVRECEASGGLLCGLGRALGTAMLIPGSIALASGVTMTTLGVTLGPEGSAPSPGYPATVDETFRVSVGGRF